MELVRKDLRDFKGYVPKQAPCEIKLDANEGKNLLLETVFPEGILLDRAFELNLYPDSMARELRAKIGEYIGYPWENIVIGNGSNELLETILKTFLEPGGVVMSFEPTFHMYKVFTQIYGGKFVGVPSEDDYSLNYDKLIAQAQELKPQVVFISNPNNPSGYLSPRDELIKLIESVDCAIVIDEAYFEFCDETIIDQINYYDNLIVLRTLSKAFGLAGLRIGYLVANEKLAQIIDGIRTPYNTGYLSQYLAVQALNHREQLLSYAELVKVERESLEQRLKELGFTTYKSAGNFIFVKTRIPSFGEKVAARGIQIRDYSAQMSGYYRITIGDRSDNSAFLKIVEGIVENEKS
ncbi:MAG: histidinol-phosphate transaminase [Anaerovoracaceae bacterium]|jgi:histidinol-phosphate aminotransferase